MVAVGGAAAVAFGVAVLAVPNISLVALIALFGTYALITGLSSLGAGIHFVIERQHHWVPYVLGGLAGIAIGAITFFRPGITVIVLVYYIAAWAIVIGIFEIVAAFDLGGVVGLRWALGLSGLLSVFFGASVAIYPGAGALALLWAIGFYSILIGITRLYYAYRVHNDHAAAKTAVQNLEGIGRRVKAEMDNADLHAQNT
jgi:uncharacterized membrane protein HdeD (DUF308 family)